MSTVYSYFATVPRGLADLLAQELRPLGAQAPVERAGGVHFSGALEVGYRACLSSRVASRILLQLFEVEATTADEFYQRAARLPWEEHVAADGTLSCEFTGQHAAIANTHFGAQRLKDAVCDRLRSLCGRRPDVALVRPAVRLIAHAEHSRIRLALDLAGEGLHRRGYRLEPGIAPLRENLAAGILLRARWSEAAARGEEFLDPMCGSGTLVIEAALIAAHQAPGLLRDYFGFLGWRQHDEALWQRLRTEARAAIEAPASASIRGSDIDAQVIRQAEANAARAQILQWVRFEQRGIADVRPATSRGGLICINPPYGERLADNAAAEAAYGTLGRTLREHFSAWEAAILSASPESARALKLRSYRVHQLWNGAIPVRLLRIDLSSPGAEDLRSRLRDAEAAAPSPGAQMFANRLRKNRQLLDKQARRQQVSCYRVYDADMPEYAFAIDRYAEAGGGAVHLHVQEYAAPPTVDPEAARRRRHEALGVLGEALAVAPERIHLRLRRSRRGGTALGEPAGSQPRLAASHRVPPPAAPSSRLVVEEGGLAFQVDLEHRFDTGLFLDQRLTRGLIRERAAGTRFLNLFCYTGTASVYAAAGAARSSVSVDLSNTYLDWAAENFRLNGVATLQHQLVRSDCRVWLQEALRARPTAGFDLIYLDPPTFSNSKRMQGVLDIQRDHLRLIEDCMQLLSAEGLLLFSTNAQRFRLDPATESRWRVADISRRTVPFDFERNPHIHYCFEIRK
jgi:23S rRNA (guanine2445-N2)-methyltransferase / 23S rRNA (guanine2069-N7)-methyltransferase